MVSNKKTVCHSAVVPPNLVFGLHVPNPIFVPHKYTCDRNIP